MAFETFCLPAWFIGFPDIDRVLKKLWERDYAEFSRGAQNRVSDAINEVLDLIATMTESDLVMRRSLYFMGKAIQPTILWHDKEDKKSGQILEAVINVSGDSLSYSASDLSYTNVGKTGMQDWDEALLAFNAMINLQTEQDLREAVHEILYNILGGMALPSTDDLNMPVQHFRWWLTEIIPASISGHEPYLSGSIRY